MADPQFSEPGDDTTGQPRAKPRLNLDAIRRRAPRGDIRGASSYADTLLRITVVLLSSVNAVMWEVYTQAPIMAALWAGTAVAFVGWMIYDSRHR
jgi:hypothetical protein